MDYIFRSRNESRELVEEVIMGRKRTLTLYERAFEDGELKGKIEKALETAGKMHEEGFNKEQIIRITGLSEDQLREHGIV